MNKILIIILLQCMSLGLTFAQENNEHPAYHITIEEGLFNLKYYQYGHQIGFDELKLILGSSPEASEIFRGARRKNIASAVVLSLGFRAIYNMVIPEDRAEAILSNVAILAGSFSVSYLLRRRYKKEIEKAIDAHNAHIARKIYR